MLCFEIPGNPRPQKQTRFNAKTGHAYNPSRWDEKAIQWQIKPFAPKKPLQGPLEMAIYFGVEIPASASEKKKAAMVRGEILPDKKPDIDNLAYIVTNALKGIVYEDDNQIVDLILRKRYDIFPKTRIKIFPIYELIGE